MQALQSRGKEADGKAEKQLTALLTIPLDKYNVVTVLSLKNYPNVMNLLPPAVRKVPFAPLLCGNFLPSLQPMPHQQKSSEEVAKA